MATVDPATYAWLSDSELAIAGCVTVVPQADPDAVARVFGHEPTDDDESDAPARFQDRADLGRLGDDGDEIWVGPSRDSTVVFEFNGYEGSRTEVLREASRLAESKVAASLYWSVNGAVLVTCARRGEVVGSIDLSYVEEEDLADVPRPLRALARLCVGDEGPDLLSVGAAMVETYAGVGFSAADLYASQARHFVARPGDLTTYEPGAHEYGPLDSLPGAQAAIDAMSPQSLRRLASWSASAAVLEAGLADDPTVRVVLDQLADGVRTSIPPGLEALLRQASAESARQDRLVDVTYDETSSGALAQRHAALPVHALNALIYTSHVDDYSAAVGALAGASSAFSSTRLHRGARFVEDERGRRLDDFEPAPRFQAFRDVVQQVLAADEHEWDGLAVRLPVPLTAAELAAAADEDRRWQAAGSFDTWQMAGAWDSSDDDLGLSEVFDRDAEVRERYSELEQRDRAVAARGPIAVEVLEPENEGGFAIALSDGLRIERLPVGRAAGRLWFSFVFTHEFGFDWNARGHLSSPHDRVTFIGSDGPLHSDGGGGGINQSLATWHRQVETAGRTWVRLDYLDGGKTVASETFELG